MSPGLVLGSVMEPRRSESWHCLETLFDNQGASAVRDLEPRIRLVQVVFSHTGHRLSPFCRDLGITPECVPQIKEDLWGLRGSLEIWFQEIRPSALTLHIQKAHFRHNTTYHRDLQQFLDDLRALDYVSQVTEETL